MIKKEECKSLNLILFHNRKPNRELVEQGEQDQENVIVYTQKLISNPSLNLRSQKF